MQSFWWIGNVVGEKFGILLKNISIKHLPISWVCECEFSIGKLPVKMIIPRFHLALAQHNSLLINCVDLWVHFPEFTRSPCMILAKNLQREETDFESY